ncbi:hypothetical protein ACP4OV_017897 [Aristida adscensionis]
MASRSSPGLRAVVLLALVLNVAVAHAAPAAMAFVAATDATAAQAPGRGYGDDKEEEVFLPRKYDRAAPRRGYGGDDGDELLPRKYDLAPAAAAAAAVAAGCAKSVLEASRPCARDVLLTLVSGTVHLSEGCCAVVARAGEKCVGDVFAAVPLGHVILPVVTRVCGVFAGIV